MSACFYPPIASIPCDFAIGYRRLPGFRPGDNPEVISSPVGLVPTNALVVIDGPTPGLSAIRKLGGSLVTSKQGKAGRHQWRKKRNGLFVCLLASAAEMGPEFIDRH